MRRLSSMNDKLLVLVTICVAVLSVGWYSEANAQDREPHPIWHDGFPDPELPPVNPDPLIAYRAPDFHAIYPQGVILTNPVHKGFTNVDRRDDGQGNEVEMFDSILEAIVDPSTGPMPIMLTGPVTTIVRGKTGNTTGTFDTEIIAMSLVGTFGGIPVEIRESPTLQSLGRTSIREQNAGTGMYEIESFFDVYTELSVGGGPFMPMQPSTDPPRMTLCPEPGTMSLLALGGLALVWWRRRR